jgi:hypothetical protein
MAAPTINVLGVKVGYKTTEFAVAVLTDVGVLAAALSGHLAPQWAGIVAAVSTAAYSASRGLAKLATPVPVIPATVIAAPHATTPSVIVGPAATTTTVTHP